MLPGKRTFELAICSILYEESILTRNSNLTPILKILQEDSDSAGKRLVTDLVDWILLE